MGGEHRPVPCFPCMQAMLNWDLQGIPPLCGRSRRDYWICEACDKAGTICEPVEERLHESTARMHWKFRSYALARVGIRQAQFDVQVDWRRIGKTSRECHEEGIQRASIEYPQANPLEIVSEKIEGLIGLLEDAHTTEDQKPREHVDFSLDNQAGQQVTDDASDKS